MAFPKDGVQLVDFLPVLKMTDQKTFVADCGAAFILQVPTEENPGSERPEELMSEKAFRLAELQGEAEDKAFFVKCDMTTMTQADINVGRLICVVGIAALKPAEFVIFRIQQMTPTDT